MSPVSCKIYQISALLILLYKFLAFPQRRMQLSFNISLGYVLVPIRWDVKPVFEFFVHIFQYTGVIIRYQKKVSFYPRVKVFYWGFWKTSYSRYALFQQSSNIFLITYVPPLCLCGMWPYKQKRGRCSSALRLWKKFPGIFLVSV